jgi:hypothetical protein
VGLVQTKSNNGTVATNGTLTVTLDTPTVAGHGLIVAVATMGSTTNPSVGSITLGGAAGNFASRQIGGSSSDACIISIWDDLNCTGGQTAVAITITGGGGSFAVMATVWERDDLPTSLAFDKGAAAVAASGTTWTSGATATTAQANEIWIGVAVDTGNPAAPTITGPSSPWVNATTITGSWNLSGFIFNFLTGQQTRVATGAATYNGTQSGGQNAAVVATFKISAGPAPTVRGRLAGNNGSTTGTTISPSLTTGWTGAAPQAGDLVFIVGAAGFPSGNTWSQTAGTGTWTFRNAGANNTGGSHNTFCAYRLFTGGETAPTFTYGGSAGTTMWALIAIAPSAAGQILAVDAWSTDNIVTTLANAFTPNSAAVSAGTDAVSVILTSARAGANLAAAITPTPPSGWTGATSGADYSGFAGGASSRANLAGTCSQIGSLTGTVAPGSESLASATTLGATLFHALLKETSPAAGMPWQLRTRRPQAVSFRRTSRESSATYGR